MINTTQLKALAMAVFFLTGFKANAAFEISAPFFYQKYENETSETTRTFYDFRLGYLMGNGLYIGAIYGAETFDYGTSEDERTNLGASIGYSGEQFALLAHYLFDTKLEVGSGTYSGTGLQVDMAYYFNFSGALALGPMLVYRNFDYDKHTNGTSTRKETRIDPAISFRYRF